MPEKLEQLVRDALKAAQSAGALPEFEVKDLGFERPADTSNGDWSSTVALRSAKLARCAPRKVAEAILDHMASDPSIDRVEAAGPGFINFFYAPEFYGKVLDEIKAIIDKQRLVWLKSGGFLVIQRTEAFTAIDVNSGKNIGRKEKEESQKKFGFLLEAFRYGTPPHGGIAYGLDRMVMLLAGESSIREVMAFPKNQNAQCMVSDAPNAVDTAQLAELGIGLCDE